MTLLCVAVTQPIMPRISWFTEANNQLALAKPRYITTVDNDKLQRAYNADRYYNLTLLPAFVV